MIITRAVIEINNDVCFNYIVLLLLYSLVISGRSVSLSLSGWSVPFGIVPLGVGRGDVGSVGVLWCAGWCDTDTRQQVRRPIVIKFGRMQCAH